MALTCLMITRVGIQLYIVVEYGLRIKQFQIVLLKALNTMLKTVASRSQNQRAYPRFTN